MSSNQAFVTLATNDEYCKGALVLAHCLKKAGTTKDLVIMISPDVSKSTRNVLESNFTRVEVIDVLDSKDKSHLAMLKRPELGITFTKIHCWNLLAYDKCVFMDADTLVLANVDELFDYDELSAVTDCGWPDIFNSGMFVFTPSSNTYTNLISLAQTEGSFDGGDQGLLNTYFTKWNRLPFAYNMQATTTYTYLPAFAKYGHQTKVVHFTGGAKPWNMSETSHQGVHQMNYVKQWWQVFNELNTSSTAKSFEELKMSSSSSVKSQPQQEDDSVTHFNKLKQGRVDVHGQDSFDKIQKKIDSSIKKGK